MSLIETRICGAKMPDGTLCMDEPVAGKTRCHKHGGASTGPRTPEGRKRNSEALKARWAAINQALAMARANQGART